jgi:hypothetical protein
MSAIIRITDLPIDSNPLKTHAIPMVNITADTTVQSSIEEIAPTLLSVGSPVYTNQISGSTGEGIKIPDMINQGLSGITYGDMSIVQGLSNITEGNYSFAQGSGNLAYGDFSHSEGQNTKSAGVTDIINLPISSTGELSVLGDYTATYFDGYVTYTIATLGNPLERLVVSGNSTFDGTYTTITFDPIFSGTNVYRLTTKNGDYSHSEGFNTSSIGGYSHAEGRNTIASGFSSHSEGRDTKSNASYSHTEGLGTVGDGLYQHVSGQYNTTGDTTSLTIIGCGTSDIDRADAFKVVPIIGSVATIQLSQVVSLNFSGDTDAGTYGVPVGGLYHDNGILRIRLS